MQRDPTGLCSSSGRSGNSLVPRTAGVALGVEAAAGLGSWGSSAVSGSIGVVGSLDANPALVATGGVAGRAGDYAPGFPRQDPNTTGALGDYVGGGVSLLLGNGDPCQLKGPFKTLNVAGGWGPLSSSASFALGDNGVYVISISSPFGGSFGWGGMVSALTTNTGVAEF
jgi:hypothetical protein